VILAATAAQEQCSDAREHSSKAVFSIAGTNRAESTGLICTIAAPKDQVSGSVSAGSRSL